MDMAFERLREYLKYSVLTNECILLASSKHF